jgi:hypothetical protein
MYLAQRRDRVALPMQMAVSLYRVVSTAHAPAYHAVKAPYPLIASDEEKPARLESCKHMLERLSSQYKLLGAISGVG